MMEKYKLTKETMDLGDGIVLYRIQALRDSEHAKKGELGGFIQSLANLSQDGDAWVAQDAKVFEEASVLGNAQIWGEAMISGRAVVCDKARVFDTAIVFEAALVGGNAWVHGNVSICGCTRIFGNARIFGRGRPLDKSDGHWEIFGANKDTKEEQL